MKVHLILKIKSNNNDTYKIKPILKLFFGSSTKQFIHFPKVRNSTNNLLKPTSQCRTRDWVASIIKNSRELLDKKPKLILTAIPLIVAILQSSGFRERYKLRIY